jgi:hypothetical protein
MAGGVNLQALLGMGGGQPDYGLFSSGFQPGMADPMGASALGSVAATNPSAVAAALASMGIPPPSPVAGDVNSGSFLDPMAFPQGVTTALGGAPGFGQGGPAALAGPAGPGIPGLGPMAGVKAPPPVAAPIFNAGVSGSQKAPEPSASAAGGSQMLQLLSLLQKSGGPAATPAKPLGQYF